MFKFIKWLIFGREVYFSQPLVVVKEVLLTFSDVYFKDLLRFSPYGLRW